MDPYVGAVRGLFGFVGVGAGLGGCVVSTICFRVRCRDTFGWGVSVYCADMGALM